MNTENPRLTIGIPIHGGERWLDGVTSNVSRVPPWSRVVISDASHLDNAAAVLTETYRDDPNVEVVSRPGTLNWVEHANLLLDEAGTEYFCWLPQDDLVSPADYFTLLVDALDSRPDCVLAFPTVLRKATTGRLRRKPIGEVAYGSPPIELGQRPPEQEAVRMLNEWNMALFCWRGVFHRDMARPIPETDDCADLIWTFSMALAGHFAQVDEARYLKRFHRGSGVDTMGWRGMSSAMDLYRLEIEARLGRNSAETRQVLAEVRRYLDRHRLIQLAGSLRGLGTFALNRPRAVRE